MEAIRELPFGVTSVVYNQERWDGHSRFKALKFVLEGQRRIGADREEKRASIDSFSRKWELQRNWYEAAQNNVPATLADKNLAANAFNTPDEGIEDYLPQVALFGVLHWEEQVVQITAQHLKLSDELFAIVMARTDLSDTFKQGIFTAQSRFHTSDELAAIKGNAIEAAEELRRNLTREDVQLDDPMQRLQSILFTPMDTAA